MAGSIVVYKKPEIIAKFYLDVARELRSFPKKVKADDGTEKQPFSQFTFYCEIQLGTITL